MEAKKVRLGSVSLLFTVIIMCVVILSVLSVSTVRADWALSRRTAEAVTDMYELENMGQRWLCRFRKSLSERGWQSLEANPPENTSVVGGTVTAELEYNSRKLKIEITRDDSAPGGYRITQWKQSLEWAENTELDLFL